MSSKSRKYCIVPLCRNSTVSTPGKTFIYVPRGVGVRRKWIKACRRDEKKSPISARSTVYCCEDHFNLEEDAENYRYVQTMGGPLRIKKGVVPHIFHCQPTRTATTLLEKAKKSQRRERKEDFLQSLSHVTDDDLHTSVDGAMAFTQLHKIHYLKQMDDVTEGVRRVAIVGDERQTVYLPLLLAVAACPTLLAAIDSTCSCDEDVVVVLPFVPVRSVQMFVDFVMGKSIRATFEEVMVLQNLCIQFGLKLDLSLLMTENASQVYVHAAKHEDIIPENDGVVDFLDESHEHWPSTEEESTLSQDIDIKHDTLHSDENGLYDTKDEIHSMIYEENPLDDDERDVNCLSEEHFEETRPAAELSFLAPHTAVTHETQQICESGTSNGFTCTGCKRQFVRQRQLQVHKCATNTNANVKSRNTNASDKLAAVKTSDGKYQCQLCRQCFSKQSWYETHVAEHSGATVHKCDQCEACFFRKYSCATHVRTKHVELPKCHFCKKEFLTPALCRKHESGHCTERYKCNFCFKSFANKTPWIHHEYIHTGERPFQCKVCKKSFRTPFILRTHYKNEHSEGLRIRNVLRFKCKFCDMAFTFKTSFIYHQYIHTGEKPFRCYFCQEIFRTPHLRSSHHKKKHPGEKSVVGFPEQNAATSSNSTAECADALPIKCRCCDKHFQTKDECTDHELLHLRDAKYECRYCGKRCIVKLDDWGEKRVHSREDTAEFITCKKCKDFFDTYHIRQASECRNKPFKCKYCEKRFEKKFKCTVHQNKMHVKERPHKCKYCNKGYFTLKNLTTHEYIHTGEIPYKCKVCDKGFRSRDVWTKHKRRHTRPYVRCEVCGKSFQYEWLLEDHECTQHQLSTALEESSRCVVETAICNSE